MKEAVLTDSDSSFELVSSTRAVKIEYMGGGTSVAVKGAFDGWNQSWPMKMRDDGVAEIWLRLAPGEYTHKFLVDGHWVVAPDAPKKEEDGFENNLLVVP